MTILVYYPSKTASHHRLQVCDTQRKVFEFIRDHSEVEPSEIWRVNAPKRYDLSEAELRELYRVKIGVPISTGLVIRDAVRYS